MDYLEKTEPKKDAGDDPGECIEGDLQANTTGVGLEVELADTKEKTQGPICISDWALGFQITEHKQGFSQSIRAFKYPQWSMLLNTAVPATEIYDMRELN